MTPIINAKRLLNHLDLLAQIGKRSDGGVCRLAFSDEDLEGRNYVASELTKLGLAVYVDRVGNLFGVLPGKTHEAAVMIGSHTDTVATGGRFDGALGVLAALECVTLLVEKGEEPERTVVVASFVNEEGVRFMPDMMGSLYHSGKLDLDSVYSSTDSQGITIGDEIQRLGYASNAVSTAHPAPAAANVDHKLEELGAILAEVRYFLELHIEQGPELESEKLQIGVVRGVQGLSWFEVTVVGQANHAGTTPMHLRADAGVVASQLMAKLHELPGALPGLRLTIGSATFEPNLINVIPQNVRFTIDVRHPKNSDLSKAEAMVKSLLNAPSACDIHVRSLARVEPCQFAESVVSRVEAAASELGYSFKHMISGAGHDAQILSSKYQSGMIFIPSKGGVSHNPTEYSSPEEVIAGANVLYAAVLKLVNQVS